MAHCELSTLAAEIGPGAADIAPLIPEARDHLPDAAVSMSTRQLAAENLSIVMVGEGERVFDARAAAQFYRHLRELREEREEAGRCNDAGRLGAVDGQIEALERELRGQRIGSEMEKMRKRIGNAIAPSIRSISRQSPTLGRHLRQSMQYRNKAWRYQPPGEIRWEL